MPPPSRQVEHIAHADQRFKSAVPVVAGRTTVQFVMEAVGGCRIGEVCGAGEGHGLLANNTAILEDLDASPGELLKVVSGVSQRDAF